uniref:Uncharacterized protein n=1 Tax=Megaselia scalaris TaxID=36166 RepID=T1GAE5_MEGSC
MEVVKTTATEILGMQTPQRPSDWRDEDYDKAVAIKICFTRKRSKQTRGLRRKRFKTKGGR